ncbi:MAG: hypothetical protein AAF211_02945 [Myxococcota bacterium]
MRLGVVGALAGLAACVPRARPLCELVGLQRELVAVESRSPVSVHVAGESIPIAGHLEREGRSSTFRPSFPFARGVAYEVRGDRCTLPFALPVPEGRPARVVSVLPDTPVLPENTLRLYLTFSVPMADGAGLDRLRLRDLTAPSRDAEVSGVFFDPRHELWSADRRRLTVLFDPGRVKTGLRAHEALGRALQAGHRYRLDVLDGWPTMDGRELSTGFHLTFAVGPAEGRALDVGVVRVSQPPPGTVEPLVVDFGRPVDHVSVGRFVELRDETDRTVPGQWTRVAGGRVARFTPSAPWDPPPVRGSLHIDTRFEDVAGNTFGAAFDHPVGSVRRADGSAWRIPLADVAPLERR